VEKDLLTLDNYSAGFIPFTDRAYPALLNHIDSAPLGLFYRGDTELLGSPQIAIVGSRKASRGGMETAYSFAQRIAHSGFTVTSGIAIGIDASAHRGALEATGKTIGVIATGIDQLYPYSNKNLYQEILESGLIISEYLPGTPPRRAHFPQRNRIISGLSYATLVVEAGTRSGSLITARTAADQGREVFAIPGSIHAPGSRGCHYLIRQGAALVESVDDILDELSWGGNRALVSAPPADPEAVCLDPEQSRIFALIEHSPCPIDQLISLSGLTTEQVSSILITLELQGLVSESIGGYQRIPGVPASNNTLKID
jgi:DNA processing protein